MKGPRFKQEFDGEWISPSLQGSKISCCDCGLVHLIEFRVTKDGNVDFRVWRDDEATAAKRQRRKTLAQAAFTRRAG